MAVDKINLYLFHLPDFDSEYMLQYLPDIERQYAIKKKRKASAYIVSRGLLRQLLSHQLDTAPEKMSFRYNRHGKPMLENDLVQFSLAHSGSYILIGLSLKYRVGIDIQKMKPKAHYAKLIKRCFSKTELKLFKHNKNLKEHTSFYCAWTRKEAFVKATGAGIGFGLKRISVSLDPQKDITPIEIESYTQAEKWKNYNAPYTPTGYIIATATDHPDLRAICCYIGAQQNNTIKLTQVYRRKIYQG